MRTKICFIGKICFIYKNYDYDTGIVIVYLLSKCQSNMSLMQLPNELLLIILGHLDVPQLIEQRVHCRHLNNLIIKNADRLSKLDVSRLQLQGAWIGVDPTIRIELNTTNAICIGTKRTKLIKLPNYGVNNEQRPILTGWLRHCQIRAIIIRKLTEKSFTDEFVDWFVDEIDNRLQPSLIEFSNINCTQVSVHRIRRLFMAINSRLLQKLNIYDLKGVDKTADALLIESMNLCSLTSLKIESKTIDDNHDRCVLFDIDDAIMHQLIRYRHIIDLNLTQCSVSVDVLCDMIEVSIGK
jgi:hypothetical protein